MPHEFREQTIKDAVLARIRSGQAEMRPKWRFLLKAAFAAAGTIVFSLGLLYVASFIIFVLQQTGVWFMPVFGFRGVRASLFALPWLLLLTAGVFIVMLEILVRRYSFAYRRPLLYSVLAILALAAGGSILVARTSFHRGLFRQAEENRLPFGGPFYRAFGARPLRSIHPGVITEITKNGFVIATRRREKLTIVVSPETRFPLGTGFVEGDAIVVFGERGDDTVQAWGVRKIDDMAAQGFPQSAPPRHFQPPLFQGR